jgi:hypothetical protein
MEKNLNNTTYFKNERDLELAKVSLIGAFVSLFFTTIMFG